MPTLVVVGNQDILTPRGDSEELAERIPTAELVVISGAAHGFMVEHATTFNRVLLEFLGRAEKAYQRRIVRRAEAVAPVGRRRRGRLMRVVVVGAGMAGLVAARTLHDESGGALDIVGGRQGTVGRGPDGDPPDR